MPTLSLNRVSIFTQPVGMSSRLHPIRTLPVAYKNEIKFLAGSLNHLIFLVALHVLYMSYSRITFNT